MTALSQITEHLQYSIMAKELIFGKTFFIIYGAYDLTLMSLTMRQYSYVTFIKWEALPIFIRLKETSLLHGHNVMFVSNEGRSGGSTIAYIKSTASPSRSTLIEK